MKQYGVENFKKNMREALNAVEAGDMVVVNRHGVDFVITTANHWNDKQVQAQRGFTTLVTDGASSNIQPDIKLPMTLGEAARHQLHNLNIKENEDGTISPRDPKKPSRIVSGVCPHGYVIATRMCKKGCR